MEYYIYHYAENGDLVDVEPFCSLACRTETQAELEKNGVKNWETVSLPTGHETDYDEYCDNCGAFIHHGLNCECEDKSVPAPDVVIRWTCGDCTATSDNPRHIWPCPAAGTNSAEN